MTNVAARCLAVSVGVLALAAGLIGVGLPVALVVAVAPLVLCALLHLAFDPGDPDGEMLLRTARAAHINTPASRSRSTTGSPR